MTVIEIVLLVLGLIAFVVSFFISERDNDKSDEKISKEKIEELVEDEYNSTKVRLQNMVDETVSYSIEKTERSLERITNEKIMALGEYSDTILNQISTNHQETVFMHDMLINTKEELLASVSKASKDANEANRNATEALSMSLKAMEGAEKAGVISHNAESRAVVAEEKMISARKAIIGDAESMQDTNMNNTASGMDEAYSQGAIEEYVPDNGYAEEYIVAEEVDDNIAGDYDTKMDNADEMAYEDNVVSNSEPGVETIQMALKKATKDAKSGKNNSQKAGHMSIKDELAEKTGKSKHGGKSGKKKDNNNEQILKLHKMGKTNMEIAKQLGLGVGEVKLVIDLYENR